MARAVLVLAILGALAGCERITVGEAPATAPTAPEPASDGVEDPGDAPCETLTRAACMRSLVCTLDAPSGLGPRRYRCRPAQGSCEIGLTQVGDDAQDRCEDRTGCEWASGACYCACRGNGATARPDGDEAAPCRCDCSGGPPPGCRAR